LVQGIDATGFTPGKHIFLLFFFVFNIICARIRQSRAPLFIGGRRIMQSGYRPRVCMRAG
jgi:hypothetical protein